MKQPALGIVATALIIAVSFGFISLFDFSTLGSWVIFVMAAIIPMEIIIGVTWGANPGLRRLAAPASEGDSAGAGEYRCRRDRGWNLPRGGGRRYQPAGSDSGPVRDRFGGGDILSRDHVRRVAVHQPDQESGGSRPGDAGGGLHHQLPVVPRVLRFQLHGGRSLVSGQSRSAWNVQRRERAGVLRDCAHLPVCAAAFRFVAVYLVACGDEAACARHRLDAAVAGAGRAGVLHRRECDGHGSDGLPDLRADPVHLWNHRAC